MKPSDLYKLKPVNVDNSIYGMTDIKELEELSYYGNDIDSVEGLERRIHGQHDFDGERYWELSSLWYLDRPFMALQKAGRGGRDHVETFLTDVKVFNELKVKLVELSNKKDNAYDVDQDVEDLDCFYSCALSDFYNPDLKPHYKVGDIVIAQVPENHLNYSNEMVTTRVEIQRVSPNDPTCTYHGLQIDRRWSDDSFGKGQPARMITDVNNGKIGCSLNDELIDHEATAALQK
jgi:hypothetical protein